MNSTPRHLLFAGTYTLMFLTFAGCRQDMQNQPKFIPLRSTSFFSDGRSARPQVYGTVARSQSISRTYFNTGLENGVEGDGLPFQVTMAVLRRGQERFNVYCSPCHSHVGNGRGMIVQRGYHQAANLLSDRLAGAPLGHFFYVMTHGYGAMPDYSAQVSPQDRWAIATYIRALQLSQDASSADLPSGAHVVEMNVLLERAGRPQNFIDSWNSDAVVPQLPAMAASSPASASASATAQAGTPAASAGARSSRNLIASAAAPGEPSASSIAASGEHQAAEGPGDVAAGKKIYMDNCSMCHQPGRTGLPPIFPSLLGVIDRIGEAKVRHNVRNGIPDAKPPMPPHPTFTESDMNDLVAFLRTK